VVRKMVNGPNVANPASAGDESGHTSARALVDPVVNIKVKLAAMWVALMFLYIYNDIMTMYRQDVIEGLLAGNLEGVEFTQTVLFAAAVLMCLPIFMVLLSVVLPARINRPLNVFMGVFHMVVLFASSTVGDEAPWAHYALYCVFEGIIIAMITWTAWKWPREESVPGGATEAQ
jgi:hypothetical protein